MPPDATAVQVIQANQTAEGTLTANANYEVTSHSSGSFFPSSDSIGFDLVMLSKLSALPNIVKDAAAVPSLGSQVRTTDHANNHEQDVVPDPSPPLCDDVQRDGGISSLSPQSMVRSASEGSSQSDWSDFELQEEWDNPGARFRYTKHLLVEWLIQNYGRGESSSAQNQRIANQSTPFSRNPLSESPDSGSRKAPKRQKTQDDSHDDEDEDGDEHSPPSNIAKAPGDSSRLACPFYKNNPRNHQDCRLYVAKNISRLKYHLKRKHTAPYRCHRCQQAFDTNHQLLEHAQKTLACEAKQRQWEGVDPDQQQVLQKRTSSKGNEKDNWFEIFSLLFPHSQPPNSPYHDLDSPEAHELQERPTLKDMWVPVVEIFLSKLPLHLRSFQDELGTLMQSAMQEFQRGNHEIRDSEGWLPVSGSSDVSFEALGIASSGPIIYSDYQAYSFSNVENPLAMSPDSAQYDEIDGEKLQLPCNPPLLFSMTDLGHGYPVSQGQGKAKHPNQSCLAYPGPAHTKSLNHVAAEALAFLEPPSQGQPAPPRSTADPRLPK
jgi:hypothetical protein